MFAAYNSKASRQKRVHSTPKSDSKNLNTGNQGGICWVAAMWVKREKIRNEMNKEPKIGKLFRG